MKNKTDLELLRLIAQKNGTIQKQKLFYHFQKDAKQYRETVSRLITKGLIEDRNAVFKLTPKGYEALKFKINWKAVGVVVTLILGVLGWINSCS